MLASEFQKYLMTHPEAAKRLSPNTLVIFQIDGDDNFNKWCNETSMRNREKDQPIMKVYLKKWREESVLEDIKMSEPATAV
jgi:hypothetical protein